VNAWSTSAPRAARSAFVAAAIAAVGAFATGQAKPVQARDEASALFGKPRIVRIRIQLDESQKQQLRERPREYAKATLVVDDERFEAVGIKIKGAAGSTREFDDRPAFTVSLKKHGDDKRFFGLAKFHLNNAAQDDSRLSDWIGHFVFDAAGYPAPRVTHARVREGDRDLGIYVLREAFDEQFVARWFGDATGNLYDGGFCQDVDADLQKDEGNGPDDHSDLRALAALCVGVDRDRVAELTEAIDLQRFVDFCALEMMLAHWDGYVGNANNYRLWIPAKGGAVFLPHGMDQLLQDEGHSILAHPPAKVASAVMQQPSFRKRYRERIRELLPLFAPQKILSRLEPIAAMLKREHATLGDDAERAYGDAVRGMKDRVEARHRSLLAQAKAPEPRPLQIAVGKPLALKQWRTAAETEGIELEKKSHIGAPSLHLSIVARGDEPRHGAWRTNLLLPKGRYELRGTARCERVEPPQADAEGGQHGGVTLRCEGDKSARLSADANWTPLVCQFEVVEFQRNVELSCELTGFAGKAWFRFDSLQLARVGD
jgi:spore coat protein H